MQIEPNWLNGHCFIKCLKSSSAIQKWIIHDNHFFIFQDDLEEDIIICEECLKIEEIKIEEKLSYIKNNKIRNLELFSGMIFHSL